MRRVLQWPVKGTAVAPAWRLGGDNFEDGESRTQYTHWVQNVLQKNMCKFENQ